MRDRVYVKELTVFGDDYNTKDGTVCKGLELRVEGKTMLDLIAKDSETLDLKPNLTAPQP